MGRPKGALGVRWGDDADEVAARLGVACPSREAWLGGEGFETCQDTDHVVRAFGGEAFARLVVREGRLAGLQLIFQNCSDRWDELRDAVRSEFGLSSEGETDIYETWSTGELIRFVNDGDFCILTIAGTTFGKAYAANSLAGGLRRLASGLQP